MSNDISTSPSLTTSLSKGNLNPLFISEDAFEVLGLKDNTPKDPFTFEDFKINLPFLNESEAISAYKDLTVFSNKNTLTKQSATKFMYHLTRDEKLWNEAWWNTLRGDVKTFVHDFFPTLKKLFLDGYVFAHNKTRRMQYNPFRGFTEMSLTAGYMFHTAVMGLYNGTINTYKLDSNAIKTEDPELNAHAFFASSMLATQFLLIGTGIKNLVNKPPSFTFQPVINNLRPAYSTATAVMQSTFAPAIEGPIEIASGIALMANDKNQGDSIPLLKRKTIARENKKLLNAILEKVRKKFDEEDPFDMELILSTASISLMDKIRLIRGNYNDAILHKILSTKMKSKIAPALETTYTLPIDLATGLIETHPEAGSKYVYVDFVVDEFNATVLEVIPSKVGLLKITDSDIAVINGVAQAEEALRVIKANLLTDFENEIFSIGANLQRDIQANIAKGRYLDMDGWDITWNSAFAKGEHAQNAIIASRNYEWIELRPVTHETDGIVELIGGSQLFKSSYEIIYNDAPIGYVSITRNGNSHVIGLSRSVKDIRGANTIDMHLYNFSDAMSHGYVRGTYEAFLAWAVKYAQETKSTLVLRDFPISTSQGSLPLEILDSIGTLLDNSVIEERQIQFYIDDQLLNFSFDEIVETSGIAETATQEIRILPY